MVNTNEDSNDGFCDAFVAGITDCTLREAINYANNTGGAWTITFAANYTITLGSQLPVVTNTIIINGNGAANTIIQANAAADTATYRVFHVNTGNLTLNRLTVRHGVCRGLCASFSGIGGGIVVSNGTLTETTRFSMSEAKPQVMKDWGALLLASVAQLLLQTAPSQAIQPTMQVAPLPTKAQ